MSKKGFFWLTLIAAILVPLVAACGTLNSGSTGTLAPLATVPAGENLYVLDGYTPLTGTNEQQIVAFHPDSMTPAAFATLPAGPTSLDHRFVYIATPQNGQTAITVRNAQTGAPVRTFTIPGTYSTAGMGFDNDVLSGNGQWLALRALNQTGSITTVALVNTQTGKLTKTIALSGTYDLDAVSPDGSRLYLLQKLNDSQGHYYVRLYQVNQNLLEPYNIVDKTIPNDIMIGTALTRQMASDGSLAYTLYVDTVHNIAFVHILPLAGDYLGARCIDLPVGKSTDLLRYYSMALSADGKTLYVANSALGIVSAINVSNADEVFYDDVVGRAHFSPGFINLNANDRARILFNAAALSPDQNTLYFAGVSGIWVAHVANNTGMQVKAHYATGEAFTSVALSANGKTLYAVDPTKGIVLIDIASGQVQQALQGPARAPWGIDWVAG